MSQRLPSDWRFLLQIEYNYKSNLSIEISLTNAIVTRNLPLSEKNLSLSRFQKQKKKKGNRKFRRFRAMTRERSSRDD